LRGEKNSTEVGKKVQSGREEKSYKKKRRKIAVEKKKDSAGGKKGLRKDHKGGEKFSPHTKKVWRTVMERQEAH